MRDTLQTERRIIVDTAVEGLFRAVEAVILFLQHLGGSPSVLDIVLIGSAGGICYLIVDILHGVYRVVNGFAAHHHQHHTGDGDADAALCLNRLIAGHKVQQDQINAHECRRDPDSALRHLVEFQTGNNGDHQCHGNGRAKQVLFLDAVPVRKGSRAHGQENKGQQE